ncbi:hypothetical protein KEM48_009703 [Puccinia striiformis f. sp. tritici PST-130]|nr:hypothetical protein KEM48_009703 [Puccinia striiformis f. sp. tritici PST-130]
MELNLNKKIEKVLMSEEMKLRERQCNRARNVSILTGYILLISRGAPNRSGFELSHRLVTDFLPHHNRRSLDPLAAKIWFYHSRFAELLQQDGSHPGLWANLRSSSMSAHRTARLRRDEDTDRLVSKTEFPDFGKTEASVGAGGMVPTGQVARWLYYLGNYYL